VLLKEICIRSPIVILLDCSNLAAIGDCSNLAAHHVLERLFIQSYAQVQHVTLKKIYSKSKSCDVGVANLLCATTTWFEIHFRLVQCFRQKHSYRSACNKICIWHFLNEIEINIPEHTRSQN
jgi:hypothetical protein